MSDLFGYLLLIGVAVAPIVIACALILLLPDSTPADSIEGRAARRAARGIEQGAFALGSVRRVHLYYVDYRLHQRYLEIIITQARGKNSNRPSEYLAVCPSDKHLENAI